MLLAKGGSNIRIFKDETSFYVYIYKSTWSRTNIEVFSDNHTLIPQHYYKIFFLST